MKACDRPDAAIRPAHAQPMPGGPGARPATGQRRALPPAAQRRPPSRRSASVPSNATSAMASSVASAEPARGDGDMGQQRRGEHGDPAKRHHRFQSVRHPRRPCYCPTLTEGLPARVPPLSLYAGNDREHPDRDTHRRHRCPERSDRSRRGRAADRDVACIWRSAPARSSRRRRCSATGSASIPSMRWSWRWRSPANTGWS